MAGDECGVEGLFSTFFPQLLLRQPSRFYLLSALSKPGKFSWDRISRYFSHKRRVITIRHFPDTKMGKARKNRVRASRADPIARASKPPSDPELAKLRESKILPILKDLKNPEAKSRTQAAGAIANIVQDAKTRKLLLREQVVHIVLTETLTDNSIDSRAAGWEILKVLAEEEEADFCVHLYRLDILTAIEHAAKAILDTLTSTEPVFSKLTKAQQRIVWEISSSLLALLNLLGMAREEITTAIVANQTIVRFLFRLAASESTPQEIYEETLSCLTTLSEDNLELGQTMTNDQETRCYDVLLKLASGSGPRSVMACGVLHNVFSSLQWLDHSPGKDGACDAVLIGTLTRALEHVPSASAVANGNANQGAVVQLALEILASIGADLQETLEKGNRSQPKEEEWNGLEDKPEGDDAMDVDGASNAGDGDDEDKEDDDDDIADLEADMEKVTGADDPFDSGDLDDLPTLGAFIQQAIPQLVRLSNIQIDGEENLAIQSNALTALNNIAWTVSCIDFSESENSNIYDAWYPAAKKIWVKAITPIVEADNADLDLATQIASLAWAIARSLGANVPLTPGQHRKFIALYQAAKNQPKPEEGKEVDPLQGLGVKCVGILGSLARDTAPIDLNREIGVFLITLLQSCEQDKTIPPADVVEAVNQIFDIYGDEATEYDKEVFWKEGFRKHLEEFLPKLRALAKGIDKRAQGELRDKADEAVLNLVRFLKYKKTHAPKEGKQKNEERVLNEKAMAMR
ncbi:hypothetical protein QC764_603070 [Podospora pseudoanserina]|uniref:SYO1-like TPR repeats domain-containing protein n=1 Tax=Podospora pseudoanserina TaxID=2609844 RepID=A0ABR0HT22_9PEZI|nr:hypothetical protein QC764_603070 [Podospora pseudoanserina]